MYYGLYIIVYVLHTQQRISTCCGLLMELSNKLLNGDSCYILPVKLLIRITL